MQYRQLPPAGDLDDVEAVWRAVPTDPAITTDCCARLCDRTTVDNREHASQWLVFLTALGCVSDDGDGYYRREGDLDVAELRDRFESRVFGVRPVLDALETVDRPLTRHEILDHVDDETRRRLERTGADEYVDRLLAWAVVFDRVDDTKDGFSFETGAEGELN